MCGANTKATFQCVCRGVPISFFVSIHETCTVKKEDVQVVKLVEAPHVDTDCFASSNKDYILEQKSKHKTPPVFVGHQRFEHHLNWVRRLTKRVKTCDVYVKDGRWAPVSGSSRKWLQASNCECISHFCGVIIGRNWAPPDIEFKSSEQITLLILTLRAMFLCFRAFMPLQQTPRYLRAWFSDASCV